MDARILRRGLVLLAALALVAWGVGVAGASFAAARRLPMPACSRVGHAALAVVAGWIAAALVMLALAILGAPVSPAVAAAPAILGLLALRGTALPRPVIAHVPGAGVLAIAFGAAAALRIAVHLARWPWDRAWSWDAYAVWGLKARHLVEAGGLWRLLATAPSHPFSHGDYPLLIPVHAAAVSWPEGGVRCLAVPDAVLALAVVIAWHELWRARIGALAAAASTLLLAWPAPPWSADLVGLADRQVALLAGLAVAVACGATREGGRPLLALLVTGLGLVKNEGLTCALLLAAAIVATDRSRATLRLMALAALPPMGWLAAMRLLHLESDRIAGLSAAPPGAWKLVAQAMMQLVASGPMLVPVLAGAAGVLLASLRAELRWLAAGVAVQAALVAFIAVHGAYDLDYQLETALPRLVGQSIPPGLAMITALAMRSSSAPEDVDAHEVSG